MSEELEADLKALEIQTAEREKEQEARLAVYKQELQTTERNRQWEAEKRINILKNSLYAFLTLLVVAAIGVGIYLWVHNHQEKKAAQFNAWVVNCSRAGGYTAGSVCVFPHASMPKSYTNSAAGEGIIAFAKDCSNAGGRFNGTSSSNLVCSFPTGAVLKF